MLIAGCILVPLLYAANAYLLGRGLKRILPDQNVLLLTALGFFAFVSAVFVFMIPAYVAEISIAEQLGLLGILQGLLVAAYALNWRWSFSRERVPWRVGAFAAGAFFVVVATWFLSNVLAQRGAVQTTADANGVAANWASLLRYLSVPTSLDSLVYVPGSDSASVRFVAWDGLNLLWTHVFGLSGADLTSPYQNYFGGYALLAAYAGAAACAAAGVFWRELQSPNAARAALLLLLIGFLNAPLFLFMKSPVNGAAWIIPAALVVCRLTVDSCSQTDDYRLDYAAAVALIAMYALSSSFVFFVFAAVFTKLLVALMSRQQHALSSFLIFALGLVFPSFFLIGYAAGIVAFAVAMMAIYGLWFTLIRRPRFKRGVARAEAWFGARVGGLVAILVAAVYVVAFVWMGQGGTFTFRTEPWVVLPNPFLPGAAPPATYAAQLAQDVRVALNVAYWLVSAGLFVFYSAAAARRRWLRARGKAGAAPAFRPVGTGYFDAVSLAYFLLLWNPLSTNVIVRLTANLDVDVSWMFFLAVTPSFFNRLLPSRRWLRVGCLVLVAAVGVSVNGMIAAANFAPA